MQHAGTATQVGLSLRGQRHCWPFNSSCALQPTSRSDTETGKVKPFWKPNALSYRAGHVECFLQTWAGNPRRLRKSFAESARKLWLLCVTHRLRPSFEARQASRELALRWRANILQRISGWLRASSAKKGTSVCESSLSQRNRSIFLAWLICLRRLICRFGTDLQGLPRLRLFERF